MRFLCFAALLVLLPPPSSAQTWHSLFDAASIPPLDSTKGPAASRSRFASCDFDVRKAFGSTGDSDSASAGAESDDDDSDEPEDIRDHSFLIEEAVNQEPGSVQHTVNFVDLPLRQGATFTQGLAWSYSVEVPLGSQKHQLSFATQFLNDFKRRPDGHSVRRSGFGDSFLSYRYQLLASDRYVWCAPRFSLILPTGDNALGLGTGALGYQGSVPISHYGKRFDFHLNAGFIEIPGARAPGLLLGLHQKPKNLQGYNFGAAVYWKLTKRFNLVFEALALKNFEFDEFDVLDGSGQVYVNPGFRYAVLRDPLWWVVGISFPLGLNNESPHMGTFVYLSVEHPIRKKAAANDSSPP